MLSVIICTYNRQKYIYNCLKSIAENDFDTSKYEILVVNNNSTDDTEGECRRFGSDYPQINFNVCCETSQGLSYARNCGIEEAKGDILVYVDDDATVNKEYLSTIADFFDRYPDAMAAGGAIYPVYETEEPKWMSKYTRELITAYKDEGRRVIRMTGSRFPSGGNAEKHGFWSVPERFQPRNTVSGPFPSGFSPETQFPRHSRAVSVQKH